MEREDFEIPISIVPKINCHWRWIDTSTLSCQLGHENQLSYATKYKIKVGERILFKNNFKKKKRKKIIIPNFKTVAGKVLKGFLIILS